MNTIQTILQRAKTLAWNNAQLETMAEDAALKVLNVNGRFMYNHECHRCKYDMSRDTDWILASDSRNTLGVF
jgi:hypothetical protein